MTQIFHNIYILFLLICWVFALKKLDMETSINWFSEGRITFFEHHQIRGLFHCIHFVLSLSTPNNQSGCFNTYSSEQTS